MAPWSHFLKQAATSTVKGSAVTLGSTVFSCVVACYIEVGAHRLVYLLFPHKYAHVEYANGLSQEQLDAVKPHNLKFETDTITPKPSINEDEWEYQIQNSSAFNTNTRRQESRSDDTESSWTQSSSATPCAAEFPLSSTVDDNKEPNHSPRIVIRPEQIVSAQDLLSCSMTG